MTDNTRRTDINREEGLKNVKTVTGNSGGNSAIKPDMFLLALKVQIDL